MRILKPALSLALFLSTIGLLVCASSIAAQEKPASPDRSSSPSSKRPLPSKKSRARLEPDEEQESSAAGESANDADGPDAIRKRAEWFYKQRSSASGRIPPGVRLKAFQHIQQMMLREGKLTRRSDGSFAEAAPQSWLSPLGAVTSPWTPVGPTPTTGGFFSPVTGRVTTIAVDPSDATGNTVLIGGAMGGIWRTTDAGTTWTPVGDQNASLSMGSIAFAPSNHSTVYAATGESEAVAFDIYYGAGVLKSTDGGLHWTQTCTTPSSTCPFIGPYDDITPFGFFTLGGTRVTYVAVSPTNPQLVLVAAQTQFSQGTTEGVYCSDNGGSTWSNILPDQLSSFVGFASSTVAYAALGNPFGSSPNAPNGNGIYKATSIGSTCSTIHFSRLTTASLPLQSSMGRIDIGIASSDTSGNTLYASIADASNRNASVTNLGVFVTTNGGTSWTQTAAPDICQHQCWYDNVVKVDPNNKSVVYFGGGAVRDSSGNPSWVVRTTNGGTTWSSVIPQLPAPGQPTNPGIPHVDNHAIAFVKLPTGKVRAYLGNDGGIWRTDDAEASTITWTNLNNPGLTLTQFYPFISINASSPSIAFGGTQDNGSQNFQGGAAWVDNQQCGDGGSTAVDSVIPSTVYIGCITGFPVNASYQNGAIGTFSPAINGINPNDFIGILPPLATDPSSANTVYFGTTKVYQSIDAGNTWTAISNDLVSGFNFDSLNVIAVAPTNPAVLYVGANTGNSSGQLIGQIFVATNVTPGNFTNFFQMGGQGNLPPRALSSIAVDPADTTGMTAYVAFSGFSFVNASFGVNDPSGHIFKTTNGGNTWQDISCSVAVCTTPAATDLPNIPVNDLVIDPDVPGTIYAATDLGVFVGNCPVAASPCTWSTLSTGLPRVVVHSLRLHEPSRTLRAATHGRGAWDINLNNFTFTGPHISSISPISANVGSAGAVTLTVNGSSLTNGAVQWNGSATGVTTTQVNDTQLTASIAVSLLSVAGTAKITVVNGTQTSNAITFSILAATPTLTSISPSNTPVQANPTTPVQIQLMGTNFSSNIKVLFNGAPRGITVAAPTSACQPPTCINATLPAALLGPYGSTNDITVLNTPPGGGQSKALTFTVVAPPPPNDNFANATNIAAFTFNDVQDSSGATTESLDPTPPCVTQLPITQNTGGHPNGAYNTIWYKYTPPVSASLNLDTQGSAYDSVLSIWTGTPGSLTNIACNDDINPGVVLQSQLQNVPLTAGTTYYIMVSSFGPPNPNPLALGGATFFHFYFTGVYPAPTLTSITPTSANSGDPDITLTLTGSNFFNGAGVQFVNSQTFFGNGLATTFVSPTQLTAILPASTITLPGSFLVSVNNPFPNNGPSASLTFTVNLGVYPVPTLNSIYPTTIVAGSFPFIMTVNGANFAPGAAITFNGVAQATTLNSTQNAYATIPTAAISTPATVQVTVTNPPPGGGQSAPQSFVITQPTAVPNITSVSPASFPAGLPANLTVNGSGFTPGAILNVGGPGGFSYSTSFVSSTQLTVGGVVVNSVGTVPIYIIDPQPAGTSAPFNLTVTQPPPPTITSINPTSAASGSFVPLTITGTGFQNGATVTFNNVTLFAFAVSTTQLTTNIGLGGVAAGTYPLTVVNPIPSPTPSNAVNFTVTPQPDFSIASIGTTTQTISAGQTGTFTNSVSVTPQNGFTSPVSLSCSLPASATATNCSVNPNFLPSGSGTASVSVTTTSRGLLPPSPIVRRIYLRPELIALVLLTLLLAILMLRIARTRRLRLVGAVPLVVMVLFILLQAIGCGGGGSTPPPPPPPFGTPAGTYTIIVTGTSGNLTHSTTLTLTVN